MDQKAINQRLKTLNQLKAKLGESIDADIKYINKKQSELKKGLPTELISRSVKGEEVQKGDIEKKREYLAYRDKHADVNYISKIKPLIDQIPDSNGSRFYKKLDVNIGIVADEFLYNSFDGVANFHYITRDNYKEYTDKLDIFLLVTTWKGLNMEWKGLGNPNIRKHRKDMFDIISHYQKNGIKTVFYSKEDPVNYDIFIELAKKCEYVFTTAEEVIDNYKRDCKNENVSVLNFGINPMYHNPIGFKKFEKKKEILFSGSWYVKYPHRIDDTQRIFDGVIDNNDDLKIIDRNYELKLERHFFPKKYVKYVSPAVDHNTLQKLHKLYDEQVFLFVVLRQFGGHFLKGVLVAHGAFPCRHHHEQVVVVNFRAELRQFVPVPHRSKVGPDVWEHVLDVFLDDGQRGLFAVELNFTIQVLRHPGQPGEPPVESRFKFRLAGHRHLYSPYGVERLPQPQHHYLPVEFGKEVLGEFPPKTFVGRSPVVQSHNDFAGVVFLERVHDAVGNVCCNPALRLHSHVGRCRRLCGLFQQILSFFLVFCHVFVVEHHVQPDNSPSQFLVSHHGGHAHQVFRVVASFQWQ